MLGAVCGMHFIPRGAEIREISYQSNWSSGKLRQQRWSEGLAVLSPLAQRVTAAHVAIIATIPLIDIDDRSLTVLSPM